MRFFFFFFFFWICLRSGGGKKKKKKWEFSLGIFSAQVPEPECCVEILDSNNSCPISHQCGPGCFRRWNDDGSSSCVSCRDNCGNGSRGLSSHLNLSTATPWSQNLGGPEVAASLILGTFFLSLFLILSVASFFYLKRANKLPKVFYGRNKASVLQPSETASMISPPASSGEEFLDCAKNNQKIPKKFQKFPKKLECVEGAELGFMGIQAKGFLGFGVENPIFGV
ncbi:uncharacterized protein C1orf159 homolog [Cinclus cinclus]|uniref:uncharacterized protein C1orf159 homolog n=1 Tax=Cinclus cinclus TaxID=127875 RepID=UPI002E13390C